MVIDPAIIQVLIEDLKEDKNWISSGTEEFNDLITSLQDLKRDSDSLFMRRSMLNQDEKTEYDRKLKSSVEAYNRFIIRLKSEDTMDEIEGATKSGKLTRDTSYPDKLPVSVPNSEVFVEKYSNRFQALTLDAYDSKKLNSSYVIDKNTETDVLPRRKINYIAYMNSMSGLSFSHLRANDKFKMEKIVRDFKELDSLTQKMLTESRDNPDDLVAAKKGLALLNRRLANEIKTFSEDFMTRNTNFGSPQRKSETKFAQSYLSKAINSLDRAFLQDMRELDELTGNAIDEKQFVNEDSLLIADNEFDSLKNENTKSSQKDPFEYKVPEDADFDAEPIPKDDVYLDFAEGDEKEILGDEFEKQAENFEKFNENLKKAKAKAKKSADKGIKEITNKIEDYNKNPFMYGANGYNNIRKLNVWRNELKKDGLEPEFENEELKNLDKLLGIDPKNAKTIPRKPQKNNPVLQEYEKKAPKERMKLFDEPEKKSNTLLQEYEKKLSDSGIKNVKADLIDALKQGNRHVFNGTKRYDNLIVLAEQLKRNKELLEANPDSPNHKEYVRAVLLTELNLENTMKEYIDIKQAEVDRAYADGKKPRFNSERRLNLVKNLRNNIKTLRDEDMAKNADALVELELDIENRRMTDPKISSTFENYLDAVVRRSVFENLYDRYGAHTVIVGEKEDEKRRKTLAGLVSNSKLAKEMQVYEDVLKNTTFGKRLCQNMKAGYLSHTPTSLKLNPDKITGSSTDPHSEEDHALSALRNDIKKSEKELLEKLDKLGKDTQSLNIYSGIFNELENTKELRTRKAAEMDLENRWPASKKKPIKDSNKYEYVVLDKDEKLAMKEYSEKKKDYSERVKTLEAEIKKLSKAHDDLLKVAENLGYNDALRQEGMQIDDSKTLADNMKATMQRYGKASMDNEGLILNQSGTLRRGKAKNINISIIDDNISSSNGSNSSNSNSSDESSDSNIIKNNDDSNIIDNKDTKPIGFRKKISKGGKKF